MILDCQVPVNILFADTKDLETKTYGQMIIELPQDGKDAEKVMAWLNNSGMEWQEE